MSMTACPRLFIYYFFAMNKENPSLEILHEKFCLESEHICNLSKHTIRWYKDSYTSFIKETWISELSSLTTNNIQTYLFNWKIERKWSTHTFINRRKWLKSFCTWCVNRGYLEENPVNKIPKPKIEKTLPKSLKKYEAMDILEYSFHINYSYKFEKYRNRALIASIIFSGLRVQEALNLKLNDLDFENNTIFVNQWKWKKDRLIPMNLDLKRYLLDYIKDRWRLKKESIYLFCSLQWDKQFTQDWFKKVIKRIKDKSWIDFSPHKLRHTFATLMLEWWCDIFALSKMLGHSDIKTTTIYLNATVTHLRDQIWKHPMSSI